MRLGFCRSQIPAACQHGSPLTQQNKRVQPWETKSQSSQPGGNVCFGCRHLNGHCLPFLFLFLKCLDLGTFESCQLVTLHAHKCFSMTWSGLSLMSEEVWEEKSFLILSFSLHRTWVLVTLGDTQGIGALGHLWMRASFWWVPYSSELTPAQLPGTTKQWAPEEAYKNTGSLWKWEFELQS